MGLKELNLKSVYYSDEDNLLKDFYLPVLSQSVKYDRIAGYFCSNSLAIAARGIANLISNGGQIRLITNVILSAEDQQAIKEALLKKEDEVLTEIENLEDELKKDHIKMLGWMIKKNLLEIKIAVVKSGIEHQKLGILEDSDGNIVSFSGSENETVQGWLHNDEQFHVFYNWKESDKDHLFPDVNRFNSLWEDKGKRVRIYAVTEAFKRGLVRNAPNNDDEFRKLSIKITGELLYENSPKYGIKKRETKESILRGYQKDAISKWLSNGYRGIFEMATGTGKTFTALGCLMSIKKNITRFATVITVPYQHLLYQWGREVEKFGVEFDKQIIADSSHNKWRDELADSLSDITLGYKESVIVLTTHDTFSSGDFISIIKQNKKGFNILLIADEVHGVGAEKRKFGLIDEYDLRLALSATPKRWFDDAGTEEIYSFFGGVVFEFGLKEAINTINPDINQTFLTPYRYTPFFISLNEEELQEYIDTTQSITYRLSQSLSADDKDETVSRLLFKRANIIKNALAKYQLLADILDDLGEDIKWTIVYSTPQQIDRAMEIINKRRIFGHRFTMTQGTKPESRYGGLSERDFILQKFATGEYQVLVAMKCLDEGVDVPQARAAIIMASSGNPREYIQRIGRIIRRYPDKEVATIYDLVVVPSFNNLPKELRTFEYSIYKKELERYEEIAKIAINNAEALEMIYKIRKRVMEG